MKNILSLFIILFVCLSTFAQETSIIPQVKARPKEGMESFMQNFIKEFKIPHVSNNIDEIAIRLKFIVEEDGSFSDIQVVDDKSGVGEEAKRVLMLMPSWNPALYDDKAIKSSFTLPIKIRIDNIGNPSDVQFKTEQEIASYLQSLTTNKIENKHFEFSCNCIFEKNIFHEKNKIEEFSYDAPDKSVFYSIGLKVAESDNVEDYFTGIKNDVERQNGTYKEVQYKSKKAIETLISVPSEGYEFYYRTMFFKENNFVVGLNVVSVNRQILDLTFNHLVKNFRWKDANNSN